MTTNRTCALAFGKVLVKKFSNNRLVNAFDKQALARHPLGKVVNAAQAATERVCRIAAITQVVLVRIKVQHKRSVCKPVGAVKYC
jgi:hypothetical protein